MPKNNFQSVLVVKLGEQEDIAGCLEKVEIKIFSAKETVGRSLPEKQAFHNTGKKV